jgi:hypothetical protein
MSPNKELWLPIKGYEGLYEVSNTGFVRSIKSDKVLKMENKNGYFSVNLYKNGQVHKYVHRLVAQTFIDNPNNHQEVNHIDCNKHNNRVDNLEWCDRKQNLKHSYEHGLKRYGVLHGCHKLTDEDVTNIRKEYVEGDREHSLHALGKKYNVNWCTIQAIVKGRLWKHSFIGGDD